MRILQKDLSTGKMHSLVSSSNLANLWVCFKLRREEGGGKLLCNSNDPSCASNTQSKAGDGFLKQKMENKNSINKKCLYTKARRMDNKQELEVNYNVRPWAKKKPNKPQLRPLCHTFKKCMKTCHASSHSKIN